MNPPIQNAPIFQPQSTYPHPPQNLHPYSQEIVSQQQQHLGRVKPVAYENRNSEPPKVDPSQIPRPPLFTRPEDEQSIPLYYPRQHVLSGDINPPPAADSRFLTCDDGNAAPQLLRATLSAIPRNRSSHSQSGSLPIGLICCPLAILPDGVSPRPRMLPGTSETEEWVEAMRVPLVEGDTPNSNTSAPPRCHKCNAYANPFFHINEERECNFCKARTDVSPTTHGTIEYVVGGPYVTRSTPVQPNFVYALDLTTPHLESYLPMIEKVGLSMIKAALSAHVNIAIVLVSSLGIYLPKCRETENNPENLHFIVASDITEDPFCPLPFDEWGLMLPTAHSVQDSNVTNYTIYRWKQYISLIQNELKPLVKQLDKKNSYNNMGHADSCGGAALAFLADTLKESGGRGTLISWRRPSFGVGTIRDRERHSLKRYKKEERKLYVPLQFQANNEKDLDSDDLKTALFYSNLAKECGKNRVVLDIIMHTRPPPSAFMDLATLGKLCRVTCGRLTWIKTTGGWKEALQETLLRPVCSFYGTDAIFKVRCSNGFQVKSYLPYTTMGVTVENSLMESPELELGVVHPDTCVAVELEHRVGGLSKREKLCYVQSALLYTTPSGQRRVRVSTLALNIASTAADVYRGVDFSAVTSFFARQVVEQLFDPRQGDDQTLQAARQKLHSRAIKAVAGYRSHTPNGTNLPHGQLILPQKLQMLPLFCMSMLKSALLRSSLPTRKSGMRADRPDPTADERAYALWHSSNAHPAVAMLLVHPNIFCLSKLTDGAGEWQIPNKVESSSELVQATYHAYIKLPDSIPPTISCLEDDQTYLIDDGIDIYILVGKDVSNDVRAELIEKTREGCRLSTSSDYGKQVGRLVWQSRTYSSIGPGAESGTLRSFFSPAIIVFAHASQKDPFEEKVMNLMVQDPKWDESDYVNFLCEFHRHVKEMIKSGESRIKQ